MIKATTMDGQPVEMGSIVKLPIGGPEMVVTALGTVGGGDSGVPEMAVVGCSWHNDDKSLCVAQYPACAVVLAQ